MSITRGRFFDRASIAGHWRVVWCGRGGDEWVAVVAPGKVAEFEVYTCAIADTPEEAHEAARDCY